MDESEALAAAREAVALAVELGASEAEATVTSARRFHVEARGDAIDKLERATGKELHVRAIVGGRKAVLASSDFSRDGLRDALRRTVSAASHVAPDPLAALPESFAGGSGDLKLFDVEIAARPDDEKIDDAVTMEKLARGADQRIANSAGSHYNDRAAVTAIANSAGFAASYAATRAARSSGPIAEDGEHKRVGHYGTAARTLREMESAPAVAAEAARRALELLGARKPPTMTAPVIFERDIAAAVLADVFAAVSAANAAVGNSWLIDKTGERLGSELVTIVDDGRMPGKLGSAPFDGEGVATRRTVVFERGVLRSLLYDTYYARKLGGASTGNSNGGSVGATNFYLEAGSKPLRDLIAATSRGVLVLDTIGFATEHATGTYSRGARGFYIENGELAYPIDEFTIAGRFADMLAGVDAVADDLRHDGSIVSPSFRVAEMTISGN